MRGRVKRRLARVVEWTLRQAGYTRFGWVMRDASTSSENEEGDGVEKEKEKEKEGRTKA